MATPCQHYLQTNQTQLDTQILSNPYLLTMNNYQKQNESKLLLLTLTKLLHHILHNREISERLLIQNQNILNKLQETQKQINFIQHIKESNNNNNTTILEELSAEFSCVRGDVHEMASTIVNSDEYVEKKIKKQLPKMFQCLERNMTNNIIQHIKFMTHSLFNNINNAANMSQQAQPPPNKHTNQSLINAITRNDNKKSLQTFNTTAASIHSQLYPTTVLTTHSQMNTKLTSTSIHPFEVEPKQMHQIPPSPSQTHPNNANIQPNTFSLPQKVIDEKDTFNFGTKSQSHTITINTNIKSPPTASGDKQLQQAQPKLSSIPQKSITNDDLNIKKNATLPAISRKNNNNNNNNNNKNSTSTELSTALSIPPKPHTQLNENNIKSACSDSVTPSPINPLRKKIKSLSNFCPNKCGQRKSINQPQTKSQNTLDSSIFLESSTDDNINKNSLSVSANIPNNINIKSFISSNKPSSIKPLRKKRNYLNKPQLNRNTIKTKQKKKKIKNNNNNKQKNKIKKQQQNKKRTTFNKKNKNNLNNNKKHLIGLKIDKKEDKYDLNKFKNEEIEKYIINYKFTEDQYDDWADYKKNIKNVSAKEFYEFSNGQITETLINEWFLTYHSNKLNNQ